MKKLILTFAFFLPLSSQALQLSTASCRQLVASFNQSALESARLHQAFVRMGDEARESEIESVRRRLSYLYGRSSQALGRMTRLNCQENVWSREEIERRLGLHDKRDLCERLVDIGDQAAFIRNRCEKP